MATLSGLEWHKKKSGGGVVVLVSVNRWEFFLLPPSEYAKDFILLILPFQPPREGNEKKDEEIIQMRPFVEIHRIKLERGRESWSPFISACIYLCLKTWLKIFFLNSVSASVTHTPDFACGCRNEVHKTSLSLSPRSPPKAIMNFVSVYTTFNY